MICSAFADPDMTSHSLPYLSLSSKYSSSTIFYGNIFTLFLTIFTAICACRITQINWRIRRQAKQTKFQEYSLSRNYQLNENALAMRLIMPLDILYAILYSIYTATTMLIRAYKPVLTIVEFIHYFLLTNMVF